MLKFPGFSTGDHDLSAKALRRRKKEVTTDKLMTDLKDDSISEIVEYFYVLLRTVEAHNHLNTPMGIATGWLSQRIHPHLVDRINDFVSVGVRDAREVKKLLKLEASAQTCLSVLYLS